MTSLSWARIVALVAVSSALPPVPVASAQPAFEFESILSPPTRVAAITPDAPLARALPYRGEADKIDEIWWLAQSTPTTGAQERAILATFPLSAPETIDDEIAKAHKLELVSRSKIDALGERLVRYRIPDQRPTAEIVAALRADQRVSSAQANLRYHLPEQEQPATEIGSVRQRPQANASPVKGTPLSEQQRDHKTAPSKKAERQPVMRINAPESADAPRPGKTPARQHAPSLVAGNHTVLRWPAADEPFVNVGTRN